MSEHTPGPWYQGIRVPRAIFTEDGAQVATCVSAEVAVLILRAVNCHDDILAAGRALLNAGTRADAYLAAAAQMRAALAKAES